ncbi:MAG: rhodanese-like domain-containing protein [Desulfobacteraceae bacterium]|nr:rhodanese-like domain-containing protein [Desulfobacteraceae bacterium]MBC2755268.1 rhodanese-like domain-containing protein [Desulfobacteraceae bacterium]
MTVSPAEGGVVEAANFGRTNVKYYPPSTTETCFSINEIVDLAATPNSGYKFSSWSISGGTVYDGAINPKKITMPGSTSISTHVITNFTKDTAPVMSDAEAVTPVEAKALIDSNNPVIVIDVRESNDYDTGHIICAQNYPWISGKLSEMYTDFIAYQNNEIIIYDQDGTISYEAATLLVENGFSAVYHMTGGLNNWQNDSYYKVNTDCNCEICNIPPMAHSGADQTVNEGDTVTLNAEGSSSVSGTIETYQWEQFGGDQTVILSNATAAQPTFIAPYVQQGGDKLIFHLTVTDSNNNQDTDSVAIFVNWFNDPPEADAGPNQNVKTDQNVETGKTVVLDGSGSSDPEGTIASYFWTIEAGTFGVELSNNNAVMPEFTVPITSGWIRFLLTVTDDNGKTDTDSVTITIGASTNTPPEADAGADQITNKGETVQLDASGSIDPDGSVTKYHWEQISGPEVKLSNSYAVLPTFYAPGIDETSELVFLLTVEDNNGVTDTDDVMVTVNNITDCSWNAVELDWNCPDNAGSDDDNTTVEPEESDPEETESSGGSSCFISSLFD